MASGNCGPGWTNSGPWRSTPSRPRSNARRTLTMTAAARTIRPAPIRHAVKVKATPERASAVFASRIGDWWPKSAVPGSPHRTITIEPRTGGRWYHLSEDGSEHDWGTVLDYAPPTRL